METSKMTSEALKVRAKNLRNAVEGMFRVSVTHSQALELVAREENYPSWDAACASFKPSSTQDVAPDGVHGVSSLSVQQMLAPSSSLGALVVVWGVAGQGKTSTMRRLIEDLMAQPDGEKPTGILHIGYQEFLYPELVSARYTSGAESILRSGQISESLIVVDELIGTYTAFEVVAMVLAGAKVIVTLHATSPIDRLRGMLKALGMGEPLLDRLLENGQVLSITASR
jgi:hypothetical protein